MFSWSSSPLQFDFSVYPNHWIYRSTSPMPRLEDHVKALVRQLDTLETSIASLQDQLQVSPQASCQSSIQYWLASISAIKSSLKTRQKTDFWIISKKEYGIFKNKIERNLTTWIFRSLSPNWSKRRTTCKSSFLFIVSLHSFFLNVSVSCFFFGSDSIVSSIIRKNWSMSGRRSQIKFSSQKTKKNRIFDLFTWFTRSLHGSIWTQKKGWTYKTKCTAR